MWEAEIVMGRPGGESSGESVLRVRFIMREETYLGWGG